MVGTLYVYCPMMGVVVNILCLLSDVSDDQGSSGHYIGISIVLV
jgi:hypothetical protein